MPAHETRRSAIATPDTTIQPELEPDGRLPLHVALEALEAWAEQPEERTTDALEAALSGLVAAHRLAGATVWIDAPRLPHIRLDLGHGAGTDADQPARGTERPLEAGGRVLGRIALSGDTEQADDLVRAVELALDLTEARTEVRVGAARLAALDVAVRAISGVLSVERVLQLIVDQVRSLVGARYAALGIVDGRGIIERFITSGMSREVRERIGDLPRGHGLLGLIIRENRSFRIPEIAAHPDSSGFPADHPPMGSFLGVPVTVKGRSVGNLYLTDKLHRAEFSEDDQRLVETFALHAGIAIENARLHEAVSRLAVFDERERIGKDLHDGIIQSLYAVGLSLEDVPDLMTDDAGEASQRVDRAIDAINLTIRDIRNFIFGLRPTLLDGSDLPSGLATLADELRVNTTIEVDVRIDGPAPALSDTRALEMLSLVREALNNVARHAHASQVTVTLRSDGSIVELEVEDDGGGFDATHVHQGDHQGLRNMRARAEALGGALEVDSAPGRGTRLVARIPIQEAVPDD
jgi:signal transduction histidine kinase